MTILLPHEAPVIGTGGVGSAEGAVEMVMAGATAVGVHTAPLLQGLDWFGKTLRRLQRWLDRQGRSRLSDLRRETLSYLEEAVSYAPLVFEFDAGTCTECGRCVTLCAYQARQLTLEGDMLLDPALCRSCGLCASVCPTGALSTR